MRFEFILLRLTVFNSVFFALVLAFSSVDLNAQTISLDRGDVTGLPLPRFVSIKSNKVNVRRGPNSTYQIDWVYTRAGVPLKVTAEYENWRRVEDFQGEGGWIHMRLLAGTRFVIFIKKKTLLKRKPNQSSPTQAIVQEGVIAKLITEKGFWSEVLVQGHSGWIPNVSVWGVLVDNSQQKKRSN